MDLREEGDLERRGFRAPEARCSSVTIPASGVKDPSLAFATLVPGGAIHDMADRGAAELGCAAVDRVTLDPRCRRRVVRRLGSSSDGRRDWLRRGGGAQTAQAAGHLAVDQHRNPWAGGPRAPPRLPPGQRPSCDTSSWYERKAAFGRYASVIRPYCSCLFRTEELLSRRSNHSKSETS